MSPEPEASTQAAVDGWYTTDPSRPALLGSRCTNCRTYVFPPATLGCPNPDCRSASFETVELSRRGRIWSYTDTRYQPPAPYVSSDPFEPFCLAAVELEEEKIVVLGQVVPGYSTDDLEVGMEVELVLGTLNKTPGGSQSSEPDLLIWNWQPLSAAGEGSTKPEGRR
jgi:uncharacterized OB-fold protein